MSFPTNTNPFQTASEQAQMSSQIPSEPAPQVPPRTSHQAPHPPPPQVPLDAPAEVPVGVPVEVPVEVSVEAPAQTLSHDPIHIPIQDPIQVPIQDPIQVPVQDPVPVQATIVPTIAQAPIQEPIISDKLFDQSPTIPEPMNPETVMREAPKKDHVSQKPIHNHTSTTSSNPITEGVNTDEDLPPFVESTLDGLASISSKINPIAQKFGKGVGRFRQYAEEKMGTAEDITILPQEYRDLEKRVDVLAQLHQNFLRVVKTYNTPAYDYPLQFQESLLGFTSTVTNQIQQLSKSVSERAQTEPPAIPTVSKPDHPKSLYHAIGRVSLKGAEDVGKEEALGAALDKFGTVSDRLGNARLTMDHEIVSKFNTPLQVNLKTSIETAMKARRKVQDKRLALDAAKTHYRESSRGNLDSARLEVEQAEDQFVGAVEEATHAMKVVLEDPEPLRDLADFAQIQLSFFKEAQDLLSGLVPQLEEYRATQETIYRGVENSN